MFRWCLTAIPDIRLSFYFSKLLVGHPAVSLAFGRRERSLVARKGGTTAGMMCCHGVAVVIGVDKISSFCGLSYAWAEHRGSWFHYEMLEERGRAAASETPDRSQPRCSVFIIVIWLINN